MATSNPLNHLRGTVSLAKFIARGVIGCRETPIHVLFQIVTLLNYLLNIYIFISIHRFVFSQLWWKKLLISMGKCFIDVINVQNAENKQLLVLSQRWSITINSSLQRLSDGLSLFFFSAMWFHSTQISGQRT